MADDKHYVMGDFYRIDERSGFKVRAGRTRKEWTGRIVRDISWEPRHPQDFVKGVRDDQTVPDPRPRPLDTFLGPLATQLTAQFVPNASGPWVLHVQSNIRMSTNDVLNIMLDTGVVAVAIITGFAGATQIAIDRNLPYFASTGNEVIDITAYASPNIG